MAFGGAMLGMGGKKKIVAHNSTQNFKECILIETEMVLSSFSRMLSDGGLRGPEIK